MTARYQVLCDRCGPQPLTEAQYDAALDDPDEPWICPKCGEDAEWDDESEVSR